MDGLARKFSLKGSTINIDGLKVIKTACSPICEQTKNLTIDDYKCLLKNTVLNIGNGLALLGITTVLCEFVLMYFIKV